MSTERNNDGRMVSAAAWRGSRRRWFDDLATGLTGAALASLCARQGQAAAVEPIRPVIDPAAPLAARTSHFPPAARRVLVIFCSGACSHLDTWDYKPELDQRDGQPLPGSEQLVTFQGANGNLVRSPWKFRPRGETGKMVSDLLPRLAELTDEFCFVHSMTSRTNTHGPGENQMSTGNTLDGWPSVGAWVSYALGSETDDLPAFVAIPDPRGIPQSGQNNWSNGFLPAAFQGTAFNADQPIPHLQPPAEISPGDDAATREFLQQLNRRHWERHEHDPELAARIASYELLARMQLRAPEAADLTRESATTHRLYGTDSANPLEARFARNCILARRLLERGVRFVQLFNGAYAMGEGVGNWDGHKKLKEQYEVHAPIFDRPAAALLRDLKARGLLADTLVLWCTEFGRMPVFQQGAQGRDHNPHGFTVWLTGAGVKRAFSYGATDDFGHKAIDRVTSIYDLHATLLHLIGLDHTRLSYFHNGNERRLTDVHGHVLSEILA